MNPWELEARESIRDLVARYNASGDSGRIDAMVELFAEDAVLTVEKDRVYDGREAIRGMFQTVAEGTREGRSAGGFRFIRHYTATHQIDVLSETEARGRCYYLVLTNLGLDHWGRYIDQYRQVGGRWLFQRREVTQDGRVEGSWAEQSRRRQGYERGG